MFFVQSEHFTGCLSNLMSHELNFSTKNCGEYPRGTVERWGKKMSVAWTVYNLSDQYWL